MKLKTLPWVILLGVVIFISIVFCLHLWYRSTLPDETQYFNFANIQASKDGGAFVAEYQPSQTKFKLKYHTDSLEIFSLWMQYQRKKEIFYFGKGINRKAFAHQYSLTDKIYFQIDYRQFPSDDFVFEILGHGGRNGEGRWNEATLPDTVIFEILEKNPIDSLGWSQYLKGPQITFVRIE